MGADLIANFDFQNGPDSIVLLGITVAGKLADRFERQQTRGRRIVDMAMAVEPDDPTALLPAARATSRGKNRPALGTGHFFCRL